jgi:hypothetical protein
MPSKLDTDQSVQRVDTFISYAKRLDLGTSLAIWFERYYNSDVVRVDNRGKAI